MPINKAIVVIAATTACGFVHAEKLTATFLGDSDASSRFTVTFDDALVTSTGSLLNSMALDHPIYWNRAQSFPFPLAYEPSNVDINYQVPNQFIAYAGYSMASGVPIDLDYFGTTVHAQAYGGGYAASILTLKRFDFSKINLDHAGWSKDFYALASGMTFTATFHTSFETYGVNLISTDGPITIHDIYSGGPWFDGVPLATVVNAVTTQWPALNSTYTESMHLVSVAPAVPEPTTTLLAAFGLPLAWFARRSTKPNK